MAKKKTYEQYLREELASLVEQLKLPNLSKQSLKQRWIDQVVWADKKADQCRRMHYRLRLTTIISGVVLPALVGINMQLSKDNEYFRDWFPYVPFFVSQVIAVSAALDEFHRYGDRWRDYRKMAEDLKAEGWQYVQLSGSYDNLTDHIDGYANFASRVESIIKNDVQNYIATLQQQQAKENEQIKQIIKTANTVATDKTLFDRPEPVRPPQQQQQQQWGTPAPAFPAPGAAGILQVRQNTEFKLSPQHSSLLPDNYKIWVGGGNSFGLMSYAQAENNHLQVAIDRGLGPENRNVWFVSAPDVAIVGNTGSSAANLMATSAAPAPMMAATAAAPSQMMANSAAPAPMMGATISGDDDYFQYVIKYGDTTDHDVQTQALAELKIQSTWNKNLDFDDLDKSLANGLPAVIGILHRGSASAPTGGGHMIVAIGRNAEGDYIINDPYGNLLDGYNSPEGGGLIYSRQELSRRWTVEGPKTGWGRLFYGNNPPGTSAQNAPAQTAPAQTAQTLFASGTATAASPTASAQYMTAEQLIQIAGANAPSDRLRQLASSLNDVLNHYQINTPLRICHFIAQVAHESDCFNAMEEYASGEDYEGRDDLGNTQPGDGVRFKGRGLMQLTGRANYGEFSKAMNRDFIAQPQLVGQIPFAIWVAGWYWDTRHLNEYADLDDLERVTRIVNGGYNGLEDRRRYLQKAKSVLGA